jgi:SAM-dependent methyltransferase
VTISLEEYIKSIDLEQLFKKLHAANPETLAKTVEHFTAKEAKKRDKIVLGYFGESGINRIVDAIAGHLFSLLKLRRVRNILDLGAGSGFFTARIAQQIPNAKFFAMDATPAMLVALSKKKLGITPFLGIAEDIEASISVARAYAEIPEKFDAIFSTLMLHHSVNPEKVFESIRKALKKKGKAVILDLCEHKFEEFKTEMGDVHLGFKLAHVRNMAEKHFSKVDIKKMPGIGCTCSGRSAEIFVVTMQNTA